MVWKTLGEDPPIVNVSGPRYGAMHANDRRVIGFNNVELITDRLLATNLAEIRQVKRDWPDRALVVSVMLPMNRESWAKYVPMIEDKGADALELNFGCPHGMSERGMGSAVGQVPEYIRQATAWCKEVARIPVIVKLTPNVTNILGPARAAKEGGADAVSLINTMNKYLGGRRFLIRTIFAVLGYSLAMDVLTPILPQNGITSDPMLNALYGGVIGGVGVGLVLRGQGTTGGTDILVRLLNRWRGIPYSHTYIATDVLVVFAAGLSFGWTLALYAVVALYVGGVAAEFAAEGVRTTRTVMIITQNPQAVAQRVMTDLQRGVTMWSGTGMYSGQERQILFCIVSRAEVNPIKAIVHEANPQAILVYNDHSAEGLNVKSNAIYFMVKTMVENGVPIHAVGLQMHISLINAPSHQDLAANMRRLANLGLQAHITEMDVRIQYGKGTRDEKLALQAGIYRPW